MAVETKNQLKQYFQTGDYPTQQQFYNLIDSLMHVSQQLTIAQITGLQNILDNMKNAGSVITLAAGTTQWDVPAGTLIEKLWITDNIELSFRAGKTNGGSDIISEDEDGNNITEADGAVFTIDARFKNAGTIYFGGVTANTIIRIYKR